MNVLPKTIDQFNTKEYWETFYTKKNDEFEWYIEYEQLSNIIDSFMDSKHRILVPGCGSSTLSDNLYDVGYRNITNVDISDTIVKQLIAKNKIKRPGMKYLKQDIFKTDFDDNSFDIVLDKATLDAICTDSSEGTLINTKKMFDEIQRILRVGGHYICVSLGQQHIVETLLNYFVRFCAVKVFVNEVDADEKQSSSLASLLPVLVFVLTKMKTDLKIPLLELRSAATNSTRRLRNAASLTHAIRETQMLAFVKQKLGQTKIEDNITLDLWDEKGDIKVPRYSLTVVDMKSSTKRKELNGKFAIFIVPQGRELEHLFSSTSGRQKLCDMAAFQRLVVATMHRGHTYNSIDEVKNDLSGKVMDLAPKGLPSNAMVHEQFIHEKSQRVHEHFMNQFTFDNTSNFWKKIPFLTADESVGWRCIIYEDNKLIVEDVQLEDGKLYRQLIFQKQASCVQSQVRLCPAYPDGPLSKSKKKLSKIKYMKGDPSRRQPCCTELTLEYSQAIFIGLAFIKDVSYTEPLNVLLIGVGGGALPSYISNTITKSHVIAVELDGDVVDLANRYFGLHEKDNLHILTDDGLNCISEMVGKGSQHSQTFDLISFDVNCPDDGSGLSGPPLSFMDEHVLSDVKSLLKRTGIFVVDVVCRDDEIKKQIFKSISKHFQRVWRCNINNDVNEIIYGLQDNKTISNIDDVNQRLQELQQFLKIKQTDPNIEIPDLVELSSQMELIT